jgi:CheY-like chemotaxis protein
VSHEDARQRRTHDLLVVDDQDATIDLPTAHPTRSRAANAAAAASARPHIARAPQPRPQWSLVGGHLVKLLLVEDDRPILDMMRRRLERRGYAVATADDGLAGVAAAHTEKPDLILLDLGLPILDGWTAAAQLRGDPATRDIPIVALTAHATGLDRDRAIAAGCDVVETKPVELDRLLAVIEKLIARGGAA